MTLRSTTLALLLAALAAGPALAQDTMEDEADATEEAAPGQMPGMGQMMPGYGMMMRGQGMMPPCGMMQDQGMMPGQGMMYGQGQGMMHGRGMGMMQGRGAMRGQAMQHRHGMKGRHHGRHGKSGPTLRIKTEGKGFEIDFECNARMPACLEAIERVYKIAGERRGRGDADKDE